MDPVSLVAAALGAGLSAGLALVGVTVAATAALRPPAGTTEPALGAPLYLLLFGTLGGLLLAGVVAWRLLRPLQSTYRRGGLALVSAFATVVLMQIYRPLDAAFGVPALLVAALLAGAAALLLAHRARRMAAT
jgi:NhaP-type Na+/H+ or K+/H+ antiporter